MMLQRCHSFFFRVVRDSSHSLNSWHLYASMPVPNNMELHLFLPSFKKAIVITAAGLLSYASVCVIYNLYFHPFSRFPGPRGAACARWWLAHWELGRGINLSTLCKELHKKYGTFPLAFV
ncbi:hypothetical protein F5888DRAFT_1698163 [Russula emetica]|nr:hypothetical protein F5888DRAFT_1698163 [Russula emetica]